MGNIKNLIPWIGLGLIVLIVLVIFIFQFNTDIKTQILTALNLILIFAYVVTTYYLVSFNKKLVGIQNTPVVTLNLRSQLSLLKELKQDEITEEEVNDLENSNRIKIFLHNTSKNNAMDVRVTIISLVNGRQINSSSPIDGSRDWHVQAGHTVIQQFKMNDYLRPANYSIEQMTIETTEANKKTQLVLQVIISYSDGFGKKVTNPKLSWYFDFEIKNWTFVI